MMKQLLGNCVCVSFRRSPRQGHVTVTTSMTTKRPRLEMKEVDVDLGVTELHVASWKGDVDRVRELLSEGADPAARSACGRTPLDVAVVRGNHAVVDAML